MWGAPHPHCPRTHRYACVADGARRSVACSITMRALATRVRGLTSRARAHRPAAGRSGPGSGTVGAIGSGSIDRSPGRRKRLAKRIDIHDGDRAMARVSTYLNFPRCTEQAFTFYRSVFGGEFNGPIHRFAEVPAAPGQPPMAEADRNLVMHVELTILGGHVLMGTDAPESMGFTVTPGNNVHINLEPDTRARRRSAVRCTGRGRQGRDAPAGHVLGRLLRQPHRPVRHSLDGQLRRQAVSNRPPTECRSACASAG